MGTGFGRWEARGFLAKGGGRRGGASGMVPYSGQPPGRAL